MDVASVTEDATAEQIAHVMESRGIRRVPVLRDGVLVGVVSRTLGSALARPHLRGGWNGRRPVGRRDPARPVRRAAPAAPWFDRQPCSVSRTASYACTASAARKISAVLCGCWPGLPGVKRVETDFTAPPPFLLGAR